MAKTLYPHALAGVPRFAKGMPRPVGRVWRRHALACPPVPGGPSASALCPRPPPTCLGNPEHPRWPRDQWASRLPARASPPAPAGAPNSEQGMHDWTASHRGHPTATRRWGRRTEDLTHVPLSLTLSTRPALLASSFGHREQESKNHISGIYLGKPIELCSSCAKMGSFRRRRATCSANAEWGTPTSDALRVSVICYHNNN